MSQIAFDGSEVRHPAPTGARLGPAQREVLRQLGFGSLTSTQAGTIVHRVRGHCGYGCPFGEWNTLHYHKSRYGGGYIAPSSPGYAGAGCCPYAATDGTSVMKRLERRGYAVKIFGLWFAARG